MSSYITWFGGLLRYNAPDTSQAAINTQRAANNDPAVQREERRQAVMQWRINHAKTQQAESEYIKPYETQPIQPLPDSGSFDEIF